MMMMMMINASAYYGRGHNNGTTSQDISVTQRTLTNVTRTYIIRILSSKIKYTCVFYSGR